jgi:hypothetical protein
VAGEAAVPDGVHGGAQHVAHAREHARVDVQDRHDPSLDDDEQHEGGEEGDEPRELANAVQERDPHGRASRAVRDLMSSPTGPSAAFLAAGTICADMATVYAAEPSHSPLVLVPGTWRFG